jgi:hypothetical protein
MRILHLCLMAIALMLCDSVSGIQNQNGWELRKKEEGIEVFTRITPDSDFKEFEGIMYVTGARLSSLLAAFDDTSSYPDWMYNCMEAKLLKKINTFKRYTYFAIKVPWPASDRDNVVYAEISQDAKTLAVTISLTGIPDYLPLQGARVRIPAMKTNWLFEPMESGAVKIVYRSKSDPGGSIPAGIVNLGAADLPYYTLLNLRKIIKEERYARARYQEIKEP